MIRGTTPTFTLNMLDEQLDLRNASNVYATFKQKNVLLTKTGNDLNITVTQESGSYKNTCEVYFTQTESLQFTCGSIEVQLNWTYADGSRACSNIVNIAVNNNLVGSVLQ